MDFYGTSPRRDREHPGPARQHLVATVVIAAPIAAALLSEMAIGLTDTVMLGGIGGAALAAGGLGANIFFTSLIILQGVLSGVGVLAARARGAGRPDDIRTIYWTGVAVAAVLSVPLFLVLSGPAPILRLAGENEKLATDVAAYLGVLRWGAVPGLVGIGMMRQFLPAIGLERILLFVVPAALALNAGLNVWLIHGGLGLPALGLRGSAAATTITLWVWAGSMVFLLHGRSRWRGFVAMSRPSFRVLGALLGIGLPVGATVVVEASLFLVTGFVVGTLGPQILAAHMIALSVASTSFMVPLAISQAANVRVAMFAGAERPAAARRAGFVAIGLGVVFMGCAATILSLAPAAIAALYLRHDDQLTGLMAVSLLRVAGLFQVVDGAQVVAAGALRGLRDTRVPMVLAAFGYWGIGFWTGRFLAFDAGMGAVGLWWGLFTGLAVVACCLVARFAVRSSTRRVAGPPIAVDLRG